MIQITSRGEHRKLIFTGVHDGNVSKTYLDYPLPPLEIQMSTFFFKFRLKLKKVGKTTRPFRYDLNQIPYDSIVEVTNRFKGLDLIDRVPEEQ